MEADEFSAALRQATDVVLGRLGDLGGQFLAAHIHLFEAAGAGDLTERVLAGLALSGKAAPGVRVQTLALLETLDASAPGEETFTAVLEWGTEIVRCNVSAGSTSWAVDVLQTASVAPHPDATQALHTMFYAITDLLRPYKSALNLADVEALKVVADELGIEVPDDFAAQELVAADAGEPYRHLHGCMVVLYSLTTSAIVRAAQVLRRLVPGIDVRTTSDHVGNPQLEALSANADVFVVVTASAAHAATEFISMHRGAGHTILVNSRGSSAILRQLAEG